MARNTTRSIVAWPLVVLTALGGYLGIATGAGLNTNVALTPPLDGWIIRSQFRYTQLGDDPTPLGRKVEQIVVPTTIIYGATAELAILGTLPIIDRRIEFGSGATKTDTGIGDIPLLAKYRFYADDKPQQTTRWAAIGGLEVPTFDSSFSSESFDPIIGIVWTHQRLDWWLDWDVLYKFNTAGGTAGDDELRADFATSLTLLSGESETLGPWSLYAIGEINTKYITDGSAQVFLSPGIQLVTSRWVVEAGVQLPVYQDMQSPRLETDFTAVLSVRILF